MVAGKVPCFGGFGVPEIFLLDWCGFEFIVDG
jgi:hypothetical protein